MVKEYGNFQFFSKFWWKIYGSKYGQKWISKSFEKMINELLYQDLFNIKTNKVMKNEIILGNLQRSMRGNLLVRKCPAPWRIGLKLYRSLYELFRISLCMEVNDSSDDSSRICVKSRHIFMKCSIQTFYPAKTKVQKSVYNWTMQKETEKGSFWLAEARRT